MTKTLEEFWLKTKKILLGPLERSNRERKSFEKSLNSEEYVRNSVFKKLSIWLSIDRKIGSIDRNTQSQAKTFNCNFDQSKNTFDRSKFRKKKKKKVSWKIKQKIAETPQSIEFYGWNAWVWEEILFKNTCLEPSFPKIKIFKQFSLKSQTLNTFCTKFKEFSNLVNQTKITHNNMYKV